MHKCLTLGKNLGMLPLLAKVEQHMAGRPRAKFSENVCILAAEPISGTSKFAFLSKE